MAITAITKGGTQVAPAATGVSGKRASGTDIIRVPSENTSYLTLTVVDSADATDSQTVTLPL